MMNENEILKKKKGLVGVSVRVLRGKREGRLFCPFS